MVGDTFGGASASATNGARTSLDALLGDAEDRLDRAKAVVGRAQEALLRAKDGAAVGAERVGDFARARPYAALAIAAAVGLIVGHIVSAHRPTVIVVRSPHLSH